MVCRGQASRGCADTVHELLQRLARHEAGSSLCWAGVGRCSATLKSWRPYRGFLLTPVRHLLMLALPLNHPSLGLQRKYCAVLNLSIASTGNLTTSAKSLDNLPPIN